MILLMIESARNCQILSFKMVLESMWRMINYNSYNQSASFAASFRLIPTRTHKPFFTLLTVCPSTRTINKLYIWYKVKQLKTSFKAYITYI